MNIRNTFNECLRGIFPFRLSQPSQATLSRLYGTYRGFAPTDESPIAMGELEVVLSDSTMRFRMATGLKIEKEKIPTSKLRLMKREAVQEAYVNGSPMVERTIGLEAYGIKYLFLPDAGEEELGLIIRGNELADLLGITFCFNPRQVETGLYQRTVDNIRQQGMFFPTLANNGQLPEEYYASR